MGPLSTDNSNSYLDYFLAFRRFSPVNRNPDLLKVHDSRELLDSVETTVANLTGRSGLLLSAGIDSALLASFLPPGSIAYTIDYGVSEKANSEFEAAALFVPEHVQHKAVTIDRDAYFAAIEELTLARQAPTVPHEAAVYLAAKQAAADGVQNLIGGFGADAKLGGLRSYYRDVTLAGFTRYISRRYFDPAQVLKSGGSIAPVIAEYVGDGDIDVHRFLIEVGTEGTSAFEAIQLAGLRPVFPYNQVVEANVDLESPSKRLIAEAFSSLYGQAPQIKAALYVPYEKWLGGMKIEHPEFAQRFLLDGPSPQAGKGSVTRMRRAARKALRLLDAKRQGLVLMPAKRGYLLYSVERYLTLRHLHGWDTPTGPLFAN